MDLQQAAERLKMPDPRVVQWLEAGVLHGVKIGSGWEINEGDVERVAACIDKALAPLEPEFAAAELLIEATGAIDGRAIRETVAYCREIVALADEWSRRAEGGAAGIMSAELRDTLAERMRRIATLHAVIRGTAITYREVRDRLAGLAQAIEQWNVPAAEAEHATPATGEEQHS